MTDFPLKPIRSEEQYDQALRALDALWKKHPEPGTDAFDRLEVLAMLIEAYEQEHHPIEAPDPIAAIEFYMDQHGLKSKDLGAVIGSKTRASEILNRLRGLTLGQIRKIREAWGLPAEVLIGIPDLKPPSAA